MLGWRKRKDGFEWREYVRTTILVRRKKRRDRIGDAGKAAVQNLKVAGQRGAAAGAVGAQALGRGAVHAGQQGAIKGAAGAKVMAQGALHYAHRGAELGLAGAQVAAAKLRAGFPVAASFVQRVGAALLAALVYAWAVLRTVAGIGADYLGPVLAPVGRVLRQKNIFLPLLIVGSVALAGGVIRAFANGFVRDTWIALLIGVGVLGALLAARWADGLPDWAGKSVDSIMGWFEGRGRMLGLTTLAALVVVGIGGAIMAWRAAPSSITTASVARHTVDDNVIEGRAYAVSGDTLKLGSTTVRLSGIEAPERDQTCVNSEKRTWVCGDAARSALSRLLRNGRITCELGGADDAGRRSGACRIRDEDVAAELVRAGHVFSAGGLFTGYNGEQREARAAKAGIWDGEAARPSEYRAQKWEEAKRGSPDGCPIKGNVRGNRRTYVVPWSRGYERVEVSQARGGRWFCSESEAQEAGFKPSEQS
jgi:endonuclease YncB( thermonuclease family)